MYCIFFQGQCLEMKFIVLEPIILLSYIIRSNIAKYVLIWVQKLLPGFLEIFTFMLFQFQLIKFTDFNRDPFLSLKFVLWPLDTLVSVFKNKHVNSVNAIKFFYSKKILNVVYNIKYIRPNSSALNSNNILYCSLYYITIKFKNDFCHYHHHG